MEYNDWHQHCWLGAPLLWSSWTACKAKHCQDTNSALSYSALSAPASAASRRPMGGQDLVWRRGDAWPAWSVIGQWRGETEALTLHQQQCFVMLIQIFLGMLSCDVQCCTGVYSGVQWCTMVSADHLSTMILTLCNTCSSAHWWPTIATSDHHNKTDFHFACIHHYLASAFIFISWLEYLKNQDSFFASRGWEWNGVNHCVSDKNCQTDHVPQHPWPQILLINSNQISSIPSSSLIRLVSHPLSHTCINILCSRLVIHHCHTNSVPQ